MSQVPVPPALAQPQPKLEEELLGEEAPEAQAKGATRPRGTGKTATHSHKAKAKAPANATSECPGECPVHLPKERAKTVALKGAVAFFRATPLADHVQGHAAFIVFEVLE